MGNVAGKTNSRDSKITTGNNKNEEETRNEESEAISIPPEMMTEVLSRLPLKPLARAQLVCKQWRALIKDHKFLKEHMNRSSCVHHWYNCTLTTQNSQPAGRISVSYLHGCDGLLLMRNVTAKKYMLWNPATRLVLDLPAPHEGSYGFALSYAALTRNYKIVSLFRESGKHGCGILTPGPSMAWRRLPFPSLLNAGAERQVSVVPAGADVHCVVVTGAGDAEIVSLDVESELLTLNLLPRGVFDRVGSARVIDWDGKVAFAAVVGRDLQVMVLQDYKKKRWCREKEVIPLPFLKEKGFKGVNVVALFKKEGGIWFCFEKEKIFVYTIETGEVSDVQQSKGFSFANKMSSSKPSLITFQGMRKDNELKAYRPRDLTLD